MKELKIHIPINPPGINQTYGIGPGHNGKCHMYKTKVALDWAEQAALIIGSEAANQEWEYLGGRLKLDLIFSNWRLDVDAPVKLATDCISQKLGFNDSQITELFVRKMKKNDFFQEGMWITLYQLT